MSDIAQARIRELEAMLEETRQGNRLLLRQLEDYRLLFEAESDAVFLIDNHTGSLLMANLTASRLYGYSLEELLSMKNTDLSGEPEDTRKVTRQSPPAMEQVVTIPLRWHQKKDGSRFPVEITARFFEREGRSVHIAAIRDISTRLAQEREKTLILNFSRELICIAGLDGYFKYLNPAWERLLGYTHEEMVSRPFLDFIHPDDHKKNDQEVKRLSEGNDSFDFENRCLHKNGSVITISWVATPLVEEGLMLCMGRDITEHVEAEEKARAKLSILRIAGRTAKVGGWSVDLKQNRVFWSDETAAIHEVAAGYSPSVADGISFYTPEWRVKITEVFTTCARDGVPYDEEMEIFTAKGRRIWIRTIGEAVRDAQGRIIKVQGAFQDISESKQHALRIIEMARDWQATFDSSNDAIFVLDADQHIRQVNKRAEQLFGSNTADMIGRHCWEVVHHSTEPLAECPVLRVRLSLQRESMALRMGEEWYEVTVDPVLDDKGEYVGAIHVVTDITLRKWTQEELLRGKERLERLNAILQYPAETVQALLDHALEEAIYLTRSKIGYIYFYDAEKQLFILNSWSKEVMNECRVLNPQTEYQLEKTGLWGEAVRQRRPIMVNDYPAPDPLKKGYPQGHVHLQRFLTVPIFQEEKIVAVVGMGNKVEDYNDTDILQLTLLMDTIWKMADRWRAQEEKKKLEEQFRQVQKLESIGRLAGGVAHDFNNMLCVILGYAEGLARELPVGGRQNRDAQEIIEAARRSAALTRQLLAFSRKQAMQPVVLDLNELLRNVEKMLRRLIGEDISLVFSLDRSCGKISADPGQMEQVVVNLAVNARDAMPNGGSLTIETKGVYLDEHYASTHPGMVEGPYIQMSVSDTGYGMEAEVLPQIFEPFFTTKEMGKGTGLGLSTVYGIVKQSGGNIWVYSEPGHGATFKLYFPVSEAFQPGIQGSEDRLNKQGAGQTILVVDDEESLRQLVGRTMIKLGYRVILAESGDAAIRLVDEESLRPALLITDVIMPGMNGGVLYQQLQGRVPGLRVLLMSGYTDSTIADRGGLTAGLPFIQKPFNTYDLSVKVDELLTP